MLKTRNIDVTYFAVWSKPEFSKVHKAKGNQHTRPLLNGFREDYMYVFWGDNRLAVFRAGVLGLIFGVVLKMAPCRIRLGIVVRGRVVVKCVSRRDGVTITALFIVRIRQSYLWEYHCRPSSSQPLTMGVTYWKLRMRTQKDQRKQNCLVSHVIPAVLRCANKTF